MILIFETERLLAGVLSYTESSASFALERYGYKNEKSNQKLGMPMEKIDKSFHDTDALF